MLDSTDDNYGDDQNIGLHDLSISAIHAMPMHFPEGYGQQPQAHDPNRCLGTAPSVNTIQVATRHLTIMSGYIWASPSSVVSEVVSSPPAAARP